MNDELEPSRVDWIERLIVKSPLGALMGLELVSLAPGRAEIRLPFRNEITTIADVVHGGALASLIDVAATTAAWSYPDLDPSARGTTIGMSVSYLRAGRSQDLTAVASVAQRGSSISVCDVVVQDAGGRGVARALVTYKQSKSS